MTAHRFGSKLNMGKSRFKFIRQHFKTGAAPAGAQTFDTFRPIQDFFNQRVQNVLQPSHQIVIDESTCAWHGKDDKRADGPPALTHMKGKPEPVSFMIKNLCDVQTGIIFAIELQQGTLSRMVKRPPQDALCA